jgi:hypothetical protein
MQACAAGYVLTNVPLRKAVSHLNGGKSDRRQV